MSSELTMAGFRFEQGLKTEEGCKEKTGDVS